MSRRVVLDTNCVISALLFSQQKMAWLRHSWQNAEITPLASKDTVSELIRVLAYPKFKLSKAEQGLLLADFLPYAETVAIEQVPEGSAEQIAFQIQLPDKLIFFKNRHLATPNKWHF